MLADEPLRTLPRDPAGGSRERYSGLEDGGKDPAQLDLLCQARPGKFGGARPTGRTRLPGQYWFRPGRYGRSGQPHERASKKQHVPERCVPSAALRGLAASMVASQPDRN